MKTFGFSSRTWMLIAVAMLTSSVWSGCDDSSSASINEDDTPSGKTCGQCADHQVCAQNGVCYDDAACAACSATQVCVSGTCYDANSPCGACDPKQICVSDTCFDANDPCANCTDTQVCVSGNCYDANDPCTKCTDTQVCVSGNCYDANSPCGTCLPNQFCVNDLCSDTPEGNGNEGTGDHENNQDPNACTPECSSGSRCIKGECEPCPSVCGGTCCNDDQVCDKVTRTCADLCADGNAPCDGECCRDDQFCEPVLGCMLPCADTEISCPNYDMNVLNCCGAGLVCENNFCIKDCGSNARCGSFCCQDGEVCEDGTCKVACEHGERCGVSEEYCCDSDTELCLFNACHPRGKACTTTNNCSFDEYCDDATTSCVNTDIVPATCQVIPKFEKFEARLQWHWPDDLPGGVPSTDPKYIRVIVMPMAANLTDDNNDGVIDENDVPDVVFIAYATDRSPDDQAPSVIRVISGDDGHEIASSAPRYWTYPLDAAIADIDNDGVPDIISGTDLHHKRTITYADGSTKVFDFSTGEAGEYIEVLNVTPDKTAKTGYSLTTKYQIPIKNDQKLQLINVADLDADGTPEIVTNFGVASIVTQDDGAKSLQWRKGCENKSMGLVHAADLDNDGIMEIISANTIYDDHCKLLVSNMSGGYIAIADLMPSSENAEETGELVPEIAHAINGKNGGQFEFWKIFKKANEDGTFTWSAEKRWNAPIPVDKTRDRYINYCLTGTSTGNCNSGAGTPVIADFNGDGTPDVGVAARYYYIVYSNDGTPNGGKVLWADSKTVDYSSACTGSSVFDFEGDGKAEVVYGDEQKLHIYTGMGSGVDSDGDGYPDPVHLLSVPNYSATGLEYPIIVDVDNDGSTEIVIASDLQKGVTMGVRAFEDPGGQWVRTRRIWNQHHYHVTNINENGSVPAREEINWLHPKLNNYRQNVQPGGVYNAPNLVAKNLTEDLSACSATETHIKLTADVANEGSLSVKAGLKVTFYAKNINDTDKTVRIAETKTDKVLPPGGSVSVTYDWNGKALIDGVETNIKMPALIYYVIDEPTKGKQFGEFVECIETDNTYNAVMLDGCPTIIY